MNEMLDLEKSKKEGTKIHAIYSCVYPAVFSAASGVIFWWVLSSAIIAIKKIHLMSAIIMLLSVFFSGIIFALARLRWKYNIQKAELLLTGKELYNEQRNRQEKFGKTLADGNIIDRLSKELEESRIEAKKAQIAKSEFLANMSHEVRTPLNGIMGFSEIMTETQLTEEQAESVHVIKSCGEILLNIINDVLDIANFDAEKLELKRVDFELEGLLSGICRSIEKKLGKRNIKVFQSMDIGASSVLSGDPDRLKQIIANLMDNSSKFTKSGEILLQVKRVKEDKKTLTLKFSVEDSGIGIPEDKIEQIFEPFCQGDGSSTRKYGGTGLGLFICRRLTNMMGGEMWVESKVNEGSTFHFTAQFGKVLSLKPAKETNKKESILIGLNILLVEDNKMNQKLIVKMLSKLGCKIDIADDGVIGVEKVKAYNYDMIFMDMQMPNMNGVDATKEIRHWSTIPIVAMTANAGECDRNACIDAGMNDYLAKPVSKKSIVTIIHKWL